jgi:recombination protein RecR
MKFTSKHIEEAVEALSTLPSIGKKSALRLVLYLLDQEEYKSTRIANAVHALKTSTKKCVSCNAYADHDICTICMDKGRNAQLVCVVESIKDMMAIEETQQFHGKYHILGGLISPLDGVGPDDISIDQLINRVDTQEINELIMAIPPSIEGETTIYYISRMLDEKQVKISVIARGVSFSSELEYADEITLGRSIASRMPYKQVPNGSH